MLLLWWGVTTVVMTLCTCDRKDRKYFTVKLGWQGVAASSPFTCCFHVKVSLETLILCTCPKIRKGFCMPGFPFGGVCIPPPLLLCDTDDLLLGNNFLGIGIE